MELEHNIEKLKNIFDITIDSSMNYDGKLKHINYFNLTTLAVSKDKYHNMGNKRFCMFNYTYKKKDAVLILFCLPINVDQNGAKTVSDRVMEIVNLLEQSFISLEYLNSEEVEEDKQVYITAIKTIE